ncbi:MAG: hypothetical protein JNJ50_22955 [Acidobacteria bacterium]|nr:hypothetical protein [Acidobacteriota bacterium]
MFTLGFVCLFLGFILFIMFMFAVAGHSKAEDEAARAQQEQNDDSKHS